MTTHINQYSASLATKYVAGDIVLDPADLTVYRANDAATKGSAVDYSVAPSAGDGDGASDWVKENGSDHPDKATHLATGLDLTARDVVNHWTQPQRFSGVINRTHLSMIDDADASDSVTVYGPSGGEFIWNASNNAFNVNADPSGAIYVPPASDLTGSSGVWSLNHNGRITPEMFGATGTGDDTLAIHYADEFLRQHDSARVLEFQDVYTTYIGLGELVTTHVYATKALADAALASLAEHNIVEVTADETDSGNKNRYRVNSAGAFVGPLSTRSLNGKGYQATGPAKRNGLILGANAHENMRLLSVSAQDGLIDNLFFNGNNPTTQWGDGTTPKNNPNTKLLCYVEGYGVTWRNNMVRFSGGDGVEFKGIIGNFEISGGDCVSQYNEGWGWIVGRMSSFKATKLWGEGNELGDLLLKHSIQTSAPDVVLSTDYWKASNVEINSIYSENASDTATIVQVESGHHSPSIGRITKHGTGTGRLDVYLKNDVNSDGIYQGCHGGRFGVAGVSTARILCESQSRNNVFVRHTASWSNAESENWEFLDSGRENICVYDECDRMAFSPGGTTGDVSMNVTSNFTNNASASAKTTPALGGIIGSFQDYHPSFPAGPSHVVCSGMNTLAGETEINITLSLDAALPAVAKTWYMILTADAEAHQTLSVSIVDQTTGLRYNWDTATWSTAAGQDDFLHFKNIKADRNCRSFSLPFINDATAREIRITAKVAGAGEAKLYHAFVSDIPHPALCSFLFGVFFGTKYGATGNHVRFAPADIVPVGTTYFDTNAGALRVSDGTAWI